MAGGWRLSLFALAGVVLSLRLCEDARWSGDVRWSASQMVLAAWPLAAPRFAERLEKRVLDRWHAERAGHVGRVFDVAVHAYGGPSDAHLDLSRPFVVRSLRGRAARNWNATFFAKAPQGDVVVAYFADAAVGKEAGGLSPGARAPLGDVLKLLAGGARAKTGTEAVFRKFPQLLRQLPLRKLRKLFRYRPFAPAFVGSLLTVPLFASRGEAGKRVRTELHCEPIANVAVQLQGSKVWTLVAPSDSRGLRPKVALDGRGYIFADVDDVGHVDRYTVTTEPGDLLFVPTLWWHTVDYLPEVTSVAVSLFHVRPMQMMQHPLFTFTLLPNLVKELVGWKTQ